MSFYVLYNIGVNVYALAYCSNIFVFYVLGKYMKSLLDNTKEVKDSQ